VSTISRSFNIDANIIFGDIEILGEAPIGGLVFIASGRSGDIDDALAFLRDKNIGVEVIADAGGVSEIFGRPDAQRDVEVAGFF
jgi:D-methionine transport system ATP-binding protein